jgi:hypothetical protein
MKINKYNKVTHMPQSSAKVKNEWSYTFATPVCLCDMDGDSFVTKELVGRRKHKNAMTKQLSIH